MALGRDPRQQQQTARPETKTYRQWKGMNLTDSRFSIDDDELAWLDNAMPVGRELQTIPIYNGPGGASLHNVGRVVEAFGGQLLYGGNPVPHPIAIVVFSDGSAWQRDLFNDGAVDVMVAPAGTFAFTPAITIWRDSPVLFIDDVAGYCSWDGTTFVVIDAAKKGHALSVFQGHVWLLIGTRTIAYTAPDTFNDFLAGHGAGSFRITDDVFSGQVYALHSTVDQLWIFGADAIDALGNVNTLGGITTFSVTNAVTSLGTTFRNSVIGYYRLLAFATGFSVDALLGVTPQYLSQKIDRLFPLLGPIIDTGPRAGIVQLNGRTIVTWLYDYADPIQDRSRSVLICFYEGRWFVGSPPELDGQRILDMISVVVHTSPELFGIDGLGRLYRLFARATDPMGGITGIFTKLYDLGAPIIGHHVDKIGLDVVAPGDVASAQVQIALDTETAVIDLGAMTVNLLPVVDSPLNLRYAMLRRDAPTGGQRIGASVTLRGQDRLAVAALHIQSDVSDEWDTVDPPGGA